MRNKEGTKTELQKKVQRGICVRHFTFLIACPPFYVIFCCLLRLLPFPSDALTGWLQQKHILLWVVFCVMSKIWCHDVIFQFFQDIFKKYAVFQFFQRLWTPCEKLCKTLWNQWDGILFNFFNFAGTFLKFYEKLKQFHQYNKLSDDMLVLLNVNKSYGKWKYILLDNFSSHIFTHLTLQLLKQKSKIIFKNSQLKWQLSGHWPDSKVNLPILLNWKFRPICCTIPFTHTVYIWKLVITPLPHI